MNVGTVLQHKDLLYFHSSDINSKENTQISLSTALTPAVSSMGVEQKLIFLLMEGRKNFCNSWHISLNDRTMAPCCRKWTWSTQTLLCSLQTLASVSGRQLVPRNIKTNLCRSLQPHFESKVMGSNEVDSPFSWHWSVSLINGNYSTMEWLGL